MMEYPKVMQCIFPACDRQAKTRKLCQVHYRLANELVKSGNTTWAILTKEGKAGRGPINKKEATEFFLSKSPDPA